MRTGRPLPEARGDRPPQGTCGSEQRRLGLEDETDWNRLEVFAESPLVEEPLEEEADVEFELQALKERMAAEKGKAAGESQA